MKIDLAELAENVMRERGLKPNFTEAEMRQVDNINAPAPWPANVKDLRSLLWCSIDNDDSRDLDQLTYGEKNSNGTFSLWIAVADVDGLITKNTPVDAHAQFNTTSVYTPAKIFPMLPEKLSTNLTSLNEAQDRVAMVVNITINSTGDIIQSDVLQAVVHNNAQLAYPSVGSWLHGEGSIPNKIPKVSGLENALKAQHEAAQLLRKRRFNLGSLTLESPEAQAKVRNGNGANIILNQQEHNFAHQLIEEFMIAANYTIATHLKNAGIASFRRVVRIPKRWDRIKEIAESYGEALPEEPDSKALDDFLVKRKKKDPESFPDLSLTIIKLLGRGEYTVETKDDEAECHFGLAICDYTHSTAPNRRFPDLITQRLYKAYLKQENTPYTLAELRALARHCTDQEDAATKVERHLNKSAAALLLSSRLKENFKGIITGATSKGTWVRIFDPPVEGKVVLGGEKLDVGDRVTVKLVDVDVMRGYIDFVRVE